MANVLTNNPIYIDTTGATSSKTLYPDYKITGFLVKASTEGNFVVELHDAQNGNPIFYAKQNISTQNVASFTPAAPIPVRGLWATTLTNVSYILVYLDNWDSDG